MSAFIDAIDAALPQTQCQRCGYPSCREYAEAIALGDATINRCPPGGEATIEALANTLGCATIALDTTLGKPNQRLVAQIREDECIGCAACLKVCPTDTIIGASKQMHTVYEADCTGCELCIGVCPIDCIDFHAIPQANWRAGTRWAQWHDDETVRWRLLFQDHRARYARAERDKNDAAITRPNSTDRDQFRAEIAAAVARSKAKNQTQ